MSKGCEHSVHTCQDCRRFQEITALRARLAALAAAAKLMAKVTDEIVLCLMFKGCEEYRTVVRTLTNLQKTLDDAGEGSKS